MIAIKNLRDEKPRYEYDVRVDRKSVLGNPFHMYSELERDLVCDQFEQYFYTVARGLAHPEVREEYNRLVDIYQIYNKLNLFCWCVPERCHAETIKRYIESGIRLI